MTAAATTNAITTDFAALRKQTFDETKKLRCLREAAEQNHDHATLRTTEPCERELYDELATLACLRGK